MSRTRTSDAEEGFTLAALIVLLTIISIIIAYTVPTQWSLVMKRERDRQTIFLMKQFARGILAFQQKNNAPPVSLQQLQDARRPRMLRGNGKWPCPLTGKEDDWILVPPNAIEMAGVPTGQQGNNPVFNNNNKNNKNGRSTPANGAQRPPSKLNPSASPRDYVGQFVGVRPNAKGKSFIALNGAEDYGEWVYTIQDLQNEITMRQMALQAQP
jgi:type II secretory pathway pseudopilin PulG